MKKKILLITAIFVFLFAISSFAYISKSGLEVKEIKISIDNVKLMGIEGGGPNYGYALGDGLINLYADYGKYGYIDVNGQIAIPFIYDCAKPFSEGLGVVYKGDKCGYIDTNGEVVIPFIYDSADPFIDGVARVIKDDKKLYINKNGEEVEYLKLDEPKTKHKDITDDIRDQYDWVDDFSEGLAIVEKDGKYGFVDENGKVVIPLIYDESYAYFDEAGLDSCFCNGIALVSRKIDEENYEIGAIDKNNNIVIEFGKYDNITHCYNFKDGISEEYLCVSKDGYDGIINNQFKETIPCKYFKIKYIGDNIFIGEKRIDENSDRSEGYIIKLSLPVVMDYPIHGDSDYPSIIEFTNKTFSWKNICVIALICIIVIVTVIVLVVKNKSKKANNKNNIEDDIENKEE